jgi:hypothetical protein
VGDWNLLDADNRPGHPTPLPGRRTTCHCPEAVACDDR